ncbi:MAG: hypothetical protein HY318_02195 [Armatimonadetes bacterium]|nr:hypothetical protein [Armatimonadota bacterium]
MTGRERLTNLINRKPVDRLAWTTLIDDQSRALMPETIRALSPLDFYRFVGCDVLQFGNYGLPAEDQVAGACRLVRPDCETTTSLSSDGLTIVELRTSWGTLTSSFKDGHPLKHPVESVDEVRVLRNLWLNSFYEEVAGSEGTSLRAAAAIGDSGLFCQTFSPSPVQQLLEYDMGVKNFYYLLQDHPGEVQDLLDTMHHCRLQEYEMFASRMQAEVAIPVENTSSLMISPSVYEKHSLPQIHDFVDIMHRHGKKAILHICGHLRNLLPVLKDTELDGINGLTPPPVGDTSFGEALEVLGDELIILGGVFNPTVLHKPSVTAEEIRAELERTYTRRVRDARFLLWIAVDGLPTPLERFLTVRDWFAENGE